MKTVRTTCAYCGVGCGITATVTGERAVTIKGDAEHPAGPYPDGLSFLRRLRGLPGGDRPKVLFCTIETRPDRIAEALAAGADDYVMKPFDGEILQSKLAEVGAIAA